MKIRLNRAEIVAQFTESQTILPSANERCLKENPMVKANAFYAQSGGVTAVINATACGVLQTAAEHKDVIGKSWSVLMALWER